MNSKNLSKAINRMLAILLTAAMVAGSFTVPVKASENELAVESVEEKAADASGDAQGAAEEKTDEEQAEPEVIVESDPVEEVNETVTENPEKGEESIGADLAVDPTEDATIEIPENNIILKEAGLSNLKYTGAAVLPADFEAITVIDPEDTLRQDTLAYTGGSAKIALAFKYRYAATEADREAGKWIDGGNITSRADVKNAGYWRMFVTITGKTRSEDSYKGSKTLDFYVAKAPISDLKGTFDVVWKASVDTPDGAMGTVASGAGNYNNYYSSAGITEITNNHLVYTKNTEMENPVTVSRRNVNKLYYRIEASTGDDGTLLEESFDKDLGSNKIVQSSGTQNYNSYTVDKDSKISAVVRAGTDADSLYAATDVVKYPADEGTGDTNKASNANWPKVEFTINTANFEGTVTVPFVIEKTDSNVTGSDPLKGVTNKIVQVPKSAGKSGSVSVSDMITDKDGNPVDVQDVIITYNTSVKENFFKVDTNNKAMLSVDKSNPKNVKINYTLADSVVYNNGTNNNKVGLTLKFRNYSDVTATLTFEVDNAEADAEISIVGSRGSSGNPEYFSGPLNGKKIKYVETTVGTPAGAKNVTISANITDYNLENDFDWANKCNAASGPNNSVTVSVYKKGTDGKWGDAEATTVAPSGTGKTGSIAVTYTDAKNVGEYKVEVIYTYNKSGEELYKVGTAEFEIVNSDADEEILVVKQNTGKLDKEHPLTYKEGGAKFNTTTAGAEFLYKVGSDEVSDASTTFDGSDSPLNIEYFNNKKITVWKDAENATCNWEDKMKADSATASLWNAETGWAEAAYEHDPVKYAAATTDEAKVASRYPYYENDGTKKYVLKGQPYAKVTVKGYGDECARYVIFEIKADDIMTANSLSPLGAYIADAVRGGSGSVEIKKDKLVKLSTTPDVYSEDVESIALKSEGAYSANDFSTVSYDSKTGKLSFTTTSGIGATGTIKLVAKFKNGLYTDKEITVTVNISTAVSVESKYDGKDIEYTGANVGTLLDYSVIKGGSAVKDTERGSYVNGSVTVTYYQLATEVEGAYAPSLPIPSTMTDYLDHNGEVYKKITLATPTLCGTYLKVATYTAQPGYKLVQENGTLSGTFKTTEKFKVVVREITAEDIKWATAPAAGSEIEYNPFAGTNDFDNLGKNGTWNESGKWHDGVTIADATFAIVLDYKVEVGKTKNSAGFYDAIVTYSVKSTYADKYKISAGSISKKYSGAIRPFVVNAENAATNGSTVNLLAKSYVYSGNEKEPGIKSITFNGSESYRSGTVSAADFEKYNIEYDVEYKDNIESGTGTITTNGSTATTGPRAVVTFKGLYKGTVCGVFTIAKKATPEVTKEEKTIKGYKGKVGSYKLPETLEVDPSYGESGFSGGYKITATGTGVFDTNAIQTYGYEIKNGYLYYAVDSNASSNGTLTVRAGYKNYADEKDILALTIQPTAATATNFVEVVDGGTTYKDGSQIAKTYNFGPVSLVTETAAFKVVDGLGADVDCDIDYTWEEVKDGKVTSIDYVPENVGDYIVTATPNITGYETIKPLKLNVKINPFEIGTAAAGYVKYTPATTSLKYNGDLEQVPAVTGKITWQGNEYTIKSGEDFTVTSSATNTDYSGSFTGTIDDITAEDSTKDVINFKISTSPTFTFTISKLTAGINILDKTVTADPDKSSAITKEDLDNEIKVSDGTVIEGDVATNFAFERVDESGNVISTTGALLNILDTPGTYYFRVKDNGSAPTIKNLSKNTANQDVSKGYNIDFSLCKIGKLTVEEKTKKAVSPKLTVTADGEEIKSGAVVWSTGKEITVVPKVTCDPELTAGINYTIEGPGTVKENKTYTITVKCNPDDPDYTFEDITFTFEVKDKPAYVVKSVDVKPASVKFSKVSEEREVSYTVTGQAEGSDPEAVDEAIKVEPSSSANFSITDDGKGTLTVKALTDKKGISETFEISVVSAPEIKATLKLSTEEDKPGAGEATTETPIDDDEYTTLDDATREIKSFVEIKAGITKLSKASYTYNGKRCTPNPTVKATVDGKSITLVKDQDYRVVYEENINAGIATVKAYGINDYIGTVSYRFQISPKKTSSLKVFTSSATVDEEGICDVDEIGLTVYDGTTPLEMDVDYTATLTLEKGKGVLIIKGQGNYTGDKKVTVPVVNLKNKNGYIAEVTLEKDAFDYDGTKHEPAVTVTAKDANGEDVTVTTADYTVKYSNQVNAGVGYVTVTGKGKITGKVVRSFTISEANVAVTELSAGNVKLSKYTYVYNGKLQYPKVTVTDPVNTKKKLTLNKDYTVVYHNNLNVGTACVDIVGIGNYEGQELLGGDADNTNLQYMITPADISGVKVEKDKSTGKIVRITYKKRELVAGTDYDAVIVSPKSGKLELQIYGHYNYGDEPENAGNFYTKKNPKKQSIKAKTDVDDSINATDKTE